MSTSQNTIQQRRIAEVLSKQHGISTEQIHFLNPKKPDDPWLPASALLAIARRSLEIKEVSERFDQFIEPLQQIVHSARVVLQDGRVFERSGVATLGEKLPDDDEGADEHRLAASRSIRAVLDAAGFNPLSTTSNNRSTDSTFDDAAQRAKDIARIHLVAIKAGLIVQVEGQRDDKEYRKFLQGFCMSLGLNNVTSSMELNQTERASFIAALEQLNPEMV